MSSAGPGAGVAAAAAGDVRGRAARLARRVVERACDARVSNEGLRFLLRRAAAELAPAAADEAVQPALLREPTRLVLADLVGRLLPPDAHALVYPTLRAELEAQPFDDAAPARKTFRVLDEDGVALAGLEVEIEHGQGATARRTAGADGWVDVSDLPGARFVVRCADGRRVLTRRGERRASAPLRIEAAGPLRVRSAAGAAGALHPGATSYRDVPVPRGPRDELGPGAADERGAETYGVAQTTWDGWVVRLQHDLRRLGFHPGPADGLYGLGTERAVLALQDEASRCACLSGRITYAGPLDGACHLAVREEVARWLAEGRRRHRAFLDVERMHAIIRAAVQATAPAGGRGAEADPYARLDAPPGGGPAVYGIGRFSQRRGDLGEWLLRCWLTDGAAFRRVFGATHGRALLDQLLAEGEDERIATALGDGWRDAFVRAAAVPRWRLEQERLTRHRCLESVLDLALRHGVAQARGLAMLWRANVSCGFRAAALTAEAIGPRPPGVPPARHLRGAAERARAVPALREAPPRLLEELGLLAADAGAWDDCEELWW